MNRVIKRHPNNHENWSEYALKNEPIYILIHAKNLWAIKKPLQEIIANKVVKQNIKDKILVYQILFYLIIKTIKRNENF